MFTNTRSPSFESSVNSYGRKTAHQPTSQPGQFESSVNSYGRKTKICKFWVKS